MGIITDHTLGGGTQDFGRSTPARGNFFSLFFYLSPNRDEKDNGVPNNFFYFYGGNSQVTLPGP